MNKTNKYREYIDSNPILKKSFDFSVDIIKLCKHVRIEHKEYSIADQLLRSGTSIGANANEAVMGSSRKDFINKMNISLKEAYETRYWILLLDSVGYIQNSEHFLGKIDEIIRMLMRIVKTSKKVIEN